jgi:cyanophycin synthetase
VARGIPYRRLTSGSLVQFGWGSKQRRIQAAEIDSTSGVAESIAQDKELTKQLLNAAGVPVPLGRPVADAEDGWAAAHEIGLPVVVKPQDGNQGKGVTVNITTREQLTAAYNSAAEHGEVMVEKFLPGFDFRLLVVGDRLVAAARRDPPQVIGDGSSTVRQLVDTVNQDPRRGEGHATSLTKIRLDDIAVGRLESQGLTPDSVPARGQRVVLRNNANLSTGGTATDVTDTVHPEVAARAVARRRWSACTSAASTWSARTCCAARRTTRRRGRSERRARPAHAHLALVRPRPRGRRGGDGHPLRTGDDGRIPVVAVTGTNGKTTTARLINHLLASSGLRTGMTNTDGVYVDGRQTDSGDCSGPKSARNVLMHPDVDAAVFEVARGGVLREGLGFDRCQVAVVTNIGSGDHLGLNYITTVEDLAVLKRVIVRNVGADGYAVLNAADPNVAAMAAGCPGHVIFFTADRHAPGHGHAPRTRQAHRLRRPGHAGGRRRLVARTHRAARRAHHAQRHHRLPGRQRDGLGGRGLGRGPGLGHHPQRPRELHERRGRRAGALQRHGLPRRHRDRRLRPQHRRHARAGVGRRHHAGQASARW